jgi:polar amino acid transport system substrate-binding protein
MANEIGKRLGLEVKLVSTAWDGIFQGLKTDKYDAIISSVSMTADLIKAYEFTKPYIANAQMIVVKPSDTSISKAEDLKDKTVGCQISTTANDSATYLLDTQKISFTLKTYDTVIEPFNDMKAGRLDAIIVDEVVGQYYIATDSKNFKAATAKLTNEPIGACFKKGNTVLKDKVQVVIDAMVADGTMKTLSQKWFNSDLTSNIDDKLKTLG